MIVTPLPPHSLSLAGRIAAVFFLAASAIAPVRGQDQSTPATTPASNAGSAGAAITVAVGQSVQAAVDAAPAGSSIALAKGAYPESITITKPLSIVGAGWELTTLGPEKAGAFTQQQKDDFFRRLEATRDPQERARIAMEIASLAQPPTIIVKDAADVSIAGLRVRGPYTGHHGGVNPSETLVRFDNAARTVVSGCAVVGPFSNGVSVINGSDVRIEKSLVAAMWGTGVQVYPGERGSGAKPAKVHVVDSDVRNCYHRCVTINGDAGSVIERNRISGSAWHGIRYDHCSPTIRDNLIFGSARFGIYASGKTAARVTGNVFWRNEMEGMGCWFDNADDVAQNTFVGNLRGGVAVLGDSTTKLTKNVIAQNPIGVSGGGIAGRNNERVGTPKPQLVSNVFFGSKTDIEIATEAKPLPEGNRVADPKFAAPEKGDFSLAADSPARQAGAGAADPISPASPFPLQPGELAIIPDGETRDHDKWKKPAAEAQPAAAPAGPTTTPTGTQGSATATTAATDKHRERQRAFAKARMRQDNRRFAKDDVAAAEELYQVANKDWRSDEARVSLQTMIGKYPELNRTGCAVLYLGQWSSGNDRELYLKRAVEKHSDCFYGNGVQVGGFARYLLAHHYAEQGKPAEAKRLFDEIRKNYPEAITHTGQMLVAVIAAEGAAGKQTEPATQSAE